MQWFKKFCRKHVRVLSIAFVLVMTFIVFIFGYIIYNHHIEQQMVTIADKFHADSSWTLENNTTISTYPMCYGIDQPCPYLVRDWKLSKPLTKQELAYKLEVAGWQASIESDCLPNSQFGGYGSVCNAISNDRGYLIKVYYYADPANTTDYGVELNVRKQGR